MQAEEDVHPCLVSTAHSMLGRRELPLTAACLPTPSPCNRRQRLGMVQTWEQYLFCHTALLAFVRQLAQQAQHGMQQ